jgi:hypothetical protein
VRRHAIIVTANLLEHLGPNPTKASGIASGFSLKDVQKIPRMFCRRVFSLGTEGIAADAMLLMMLLQTPANPPANEAILAGGIWAEVSGRSRQVAQLNAPFTAGRLHSDPLSG